jgi:hypothetical protein
VVCRVLLFLGAVPDEVVGRTALATSHDLSVLVAWILAATETFPGTFALSFAEAQKHPLVFMLQLGLISCKLDIGLPEIWAWLPPRRLLLSEAMEAQSTPKLADWLVAVVSPPLLLGLAVLKPKPFSLVFTIGSGRHRSAVIRGRGTARLGVISRGPRGVAEVVAHHEGLNNSGKLGYWNRDAQVGQVRDFFSW